MNEINRQLSRAEAIKLFEQNAVLHGTADAIDIHRIGELFGEKILLKLDYWITVPGFFSPGRDWNSWGACGDDPLLPYILQQGFMRIVSQHNHDLQVTAHKASESGKLYDRLVDERRARIEAEDAEEERKRQERRAKRASQKS